MDKIERVAKALYDADEGLKGVWMPEVPGLCDKYFHFAKAAIEVMEPDRHALIHKICPKMKEWSEPKGQRPYKCEGCPASHYIEGHGECTQMCYLIAKEVVDILFPEK